MNKDKMVEESEKQKKRIIKLDEYAKVKIIVACDENEEPVSEAIMRNCSDYELAKLVICMETMIRAIEKQSPMVSLIKLNMGCKTTTTVVEG